MSKDALILLFGIAGSSERFSSGNTLGIGGCYAIEKIKDSIQYFTHRLNWFHVMSVERHIFNQFMNGTK